MSDPLAVPLAAEAVYVLLGVLVSSCWLDVEATGVVCGCLCFLNALLLEALLL